MPIHIVLTDDHPIVLEGLEALFRLQSDIQIVARCGNGAEALHAVRQHRPDILVLDMNLPDMSGLDVLRELHREKAATRIVLLAATLTDDEVLEALHLGVQGMVLKELASQLLKQCIRRVYAGEQWFEKQLAARAVNALLRREGRHGAQRDGLTPRESDIVRLVVNGLSNADTAKRLGIGEGTVKMHLHKVYKKLKLRSRLELVLYAQARPLVQENK